VKEQLTSFLAKEQIANLVRGLGRRISQDYARVLTPGETLEVIVTLKGAFIFASDLARELTIPIKLDFIRLASYGARTSSGGKVELITDLTPPSEGAHILILDEIVDSGRTLSFLVERLAGCRPKSVKICSLLNKPSRREVDVKLDYVGMDIEDKFVVGYGLDFNEQYRNLPEICILNPV
jgi:hypoxanthine phosphoribosyltransferase